MPAPARFDLSGLVEKISPGGAYFKYARAVAFALGGILVVLVAFLIFPSIKNLFIKRPPSSPGVAKCSQINKIPLAKGFQSWTFSYGNGYTGPQIQTASIDTLSPPKGSTQTVTLTMKNASPVTKAIATVFTDNTSQSYDLNMIKGSPTDGTWVGIWKIDDSHECTYHIDFVLVSPSGDSTNALTFR